MKDGYDEQIAFVLESDPAAVHDLWIRRVGLFRCLGDGDSACPLCVHEGDDSFAATPDMTATVRADRTFARFDAYMRINDTVGLGGALKDPAALERLAVLQRACDAHLGRGPYKFQETTVDEVQYEDLHGGGIDVDGVLVARPWAECLAEAEKAYNIRRTEEWDEGNRRLDAALERIAKEDADAARQSP